MIGGIFRNGLQKTEKRPVDLRRPLHRRPMPNAFDEDFAAHVRDPLVHLRRHLAPRKLQHRVFRSGDEERRLFDLCGFKLGRHLDVAINVPIPVERPAKAALLELRDVIIQVFFGQPRGQLSRVSHSVQEFRSRRFPANQRPRSGVAGDREINRPQRFPNAGFKFGLSHAGLLEINHVPEIVAVKFLFGQRPGSPSRVRHAHSDDCAHPRRMQKRRMPRDRRAPIVTERAGKPGDIVRQFDDVVGFNLRRPVAASITALVWRGHLEPGGDQRINLMPPQVPALREAVQENDQRAIAFDDGAQADAIRFDQLKIWFFHAVPPGVVSALRLPEQRFITCLNEMFVRGERICQTALLHNHE